MVAAGTAAHSDHARGISEVFLATAKGGFDFSLKTTETLGCHGFRVEIGDRSVKEIAIDVGNKAGRVRTRRSPSFKRAL
jgi:carbon-monoxide dehydrogenase catalytic subunit